MKRGVWFILVILCIFLPNFAASADVEDALHLNIQVTNSSNNNSILTGTFTFIFNISTSSSCTPVVYTNSSTLTTDSRGIISHYLTNTNLDYSEQYWLCYYRDGVLINASKIARVPYAFRARNVTLSGVDVDTNLNLGGYNITASIGSFGVIIPTYSLNVMGNVNVTQNLTVGGNVGIGTTTPSSKLHVEGNATFVGIGIFGGDFIPLGSEPVSINGSGSGISMGDRLGGTFARWVIYPSNGFLRFWNGADKMVIQNSTGNVGIGTATPTSTLHINTSNNINSGSNLANGIAGLRISDVNYGLLFDTNQIEQMNSTNAIYLNYNSSADVSINLGGGKVGIGTAYPTQKLEVAGNVNISSGGNLTIGAGMIYYNGSTLIIKVN